MKRELLIGCGHARDKRVSVDGNMHWSELYTLDQQPQPDERFFLCDLNSGHHVKGKRRWRIESYQSESAGLDERMASAAKGTYISSCTEGLLESISGHVDDAWMFKESIFDEVHAYEVLEHLSWQGNASGFFGDFAEIWRVLKPAGYLCATVPSRFSPWLWGDPSHTRAILPESLVFLDQSQYVRQLDGPQKTAMSDFRAIYQADFRIVRSQDNHETHEFILQAVKPSRWTK